MSVASLLGDEIAVAPAMILINSHWSSSNSPMVLTPFPDIPAILVP
jgi:hypothetical protein